MNSSELLNRAMLFNLNKFASQLGFIKKVSRYINKEDAILLLNLAEECIHKYSEELNSKTRNTYLNKILLICALVNEHKDPKWVNLISIITSILLRVGLNPTALMISENKTEEKYNSLGSFISEIYSTRKIIEHEVKVTDQKSVVLSSFQKRVWSAVDKCKNIGISAPTSAGKSYILIKKIINEISKKDKANVIIVVPTISLINQFIADLTKACKEFKVGEVNISQSITENKLFPASKNIYVLTQERVMTGLLNSEKVFDVIDMFIVDEIQNIEKIAEQGDERAKTLLNVILEIIQDKKPQKVIVSGPMLINLSTVLESWFGKNNFIAIEEEIPPVFNITYSFEKKHRAHGKLYFIQHDNITGKKRLEIEDKHEISNYVLDRSEYGGKDKTHELISHCLKKLKNEGTIIFSKTVKQATDTALFLAKKNKKKNYFPKLSEYLAETIHPKYSLLKTLEKGVAYHHGKMPHHCRKIVEHLFKKEKISVIVCTTTLMQGINLPAKNLIIRNPDLANNLKLSNYEFGNLRGRAGRLMQDFIGRTIAIDSKLFEENDTDLTKTDGKELDSNYKDKFEKNKNDIEEQIDNPDDIENESIAKDLVIYIKHIILKYGKDSVNKLNKIGINLNLGRIEKIRKEFELYKVDKQICLKFPYWDPKDIDRMYLFFKSGLFEIFPTDPYRNLSQILESNLHSMAKHFPYYFNRYLSTDVDKFIRSLSIFAESFAKGNPLKLVIEPPNNNWKVKESKDVDDRIKNIFQNVMYNIPKLLKPLIHIQNINNNILTYIELGAFDPSLRYLIELGIPREVAIRLVNNLECNFLVKNDEGNIVVDNYLLKTFFNKAGCSTNLSEWDKIVIKDFL